MLQRQQRRVALISQASIQVRAKNGSNIFDNLREMVLEWLEKKPEQAFLSKCVLAIPPNSMFWGLSVLRLFLLMNRYIGRVVKTTKMQTFHDAVG